MQAVEPDWSVPDGVSQMWHFHPKYGWMNDPNGLFFLDGKWHVFYQYNPLGVTWGNMHWGHAVSSDLRHWSHLPIALYPDEWGTMYSGSAVIDTDNTAGFGKNAILLYYTNASYDSLQGMQCLAISTDNGITFNKFNDGQPVIGNITRDRDRDPNIAWDADANVWRLALYFGTSASKNRFGLFESKNLLDWTPSDVYEIPYGAECPGIRPMQDEATGQTRWLFFDASCRYLVGDISRDGRIHFENQEPRCFFYGAAYAGQCFFGAPDNKNIYLAWLRMKPAQERQWTGCLSCPIELRLNNGELLVRPYHGFDDGDKALLKDFLVESPIGAAGHGMVLRDTFTAEYFDASERFAVGCV
ncbi:MAG: glycoside hydrolase family 32 protein [Victivallales bacterium]|nr:glycoside hydrolase family 32 protein [Victivallales bacterium]